MQQRFSSATQTPLFSSCPRYSFGTCQDESSQEHYLAREIVGRTKETVVRLGELERLRWGTSSGFLDHRLPPRREVRSTPLARDLLLLLDVHPIVASLAGFLFPFPVDVVRECTPVQLRYGTDITVERQLLTHGAELELDGLEAISELLAALLVAWR